ncbi:MAG: hypothetical protein AAGD07_20100 [Planctomycetota bacterium]
MLLPLLVPPCRLTTRPRQRFPLYGRLATAVFLCVFGSRLPCLGQEEREPSEVVFTEPDPAVEQLRLFTNGDAKQLGTSLARLIRMGEVDVVNEVLAATSARDFEPADKAIIADAIGTNLRLRITADAAVSAESVNVLNDLFAAQGEILVDPNRLRDAARGLTSVSPDARLSAARVLLRAGQDSIPTLVELHRSVRASSDRSSEDAALRMLAKIDRDSAIDALEQICLHGPSDVRASALAGVARLAGKDSLRTAIGSLHRSDGSEDLSSMAAQVIHRYLGRSISPVEARQWLARDLNVGFENLQRLRRGGGSTVVWTVQPSDGRLVHSRSSQLVHHYRQVADLAYWVQLARDEANKAMSSDVLAASLAYRIVNDPDWGLVDDKAQATDLASMAMALKDHVAQSRAGLDPLIEGAKQTNNDPALLALLRLLPRISDDPSLSPNWLDALLRSDRGNITSLVSLVDHPCARIRFEAASVLAGLPETHPYPGQRRVKERLLSMSRLDDRPKAILLENRPDVIAEWQPLLAQLGFGVHLVTNGLMLEKRLASGDDIELIVSKDHPKDIPAITLVDRVRRMPYGRDVPLIFFDEAIEPPSVELLATEITDELLDTEDETLVYRTGLLPESSQVGIVRYDPLVGDLDRDLTTNFDPQLSYRAESRWGDQSRRAGLVWHIARPRTVAGLYQLADEVRRTQHIPPMTPTDRNSFRFLARTILDGSPGEPVTEATPK